MCCHPLILTAGYAPYEIRHVAGFEGFTKERFERCLDLYLCPRSLKRRLNIDPETLVPKLPKPQDLKPFPDAQVCNILFG